MYTNVLFFEAHYTRSSTQREAVTSVKPLSSPETAQSEIRGARALLLADKAQAAADKFRDVRSRPGISEAALAAVYEGLSELVAGRSVESRETFGTLAQVSGANGGSENSASNVFSEIGRLGRTEEHVQESSKKLFASTPEGLPGASHARYQGRPGGASLPLDHPAPRVSLQGESFDLRWGCEKPRPPGSPVD